MWVSKRTAWPADLTPLERFVTERIIQRCEVNECISNKHRTSNGYTQLKEILSLSILSMDRTKTIRTVKVLLEEAKSSLFRQNIVNDEIIRTYFSDLKAFIKNYDSNKLSNGNDQLNLTELNSFIHQLKIFEAQLDKGYFQCLMKEFLAINYDNTEQFHREAKKVAELVDLLIPYLVFKGYAISALSEVLKSWIEKKYKGTVRRMFSYFNFQKRNYEYVIKVSPEADKDFQGILPVIQEVLGDEIISGKKNSLNNNSKQLQIFSANQNLIIYNHQDLDPHIHIRSFYDGLLKKLVQKRERQSLAFFNSFFDSCYWRMPRPGKQLHFIQLDNDPINVNSRGRTLRKSLLQLNKDFTYDFDLETYITIPKNAQLNNSLYYYNLALGSKSIENSLSLLWTSLESLLPFRSFNSDIVCVQDFVSKSLSLGAITRDIFALATRFENTEARNNQPFQSLNLPNTKDYSIKESVADWYTWLVDQNDLEQKFNTIKAESELLAFEYYRVAKPLIDGKLEGLHQRILRSHDSMEFQLQRIYLHRNQIIHSGNLVNEYTNLWMHLEWYIGKLLAYSIIEIEIKGKNLTPRDLFIEVHADYDYVMSYLEKNGNVQIADISQRIKEILLEYSWQSF